MADGFDDDGLAPAQNDGAEASHTIDLGGSSPERDNQPLAPISK